MSGGQVSTERIAHAIQCGASPPFPHVGNDTMVVVASIVLGVVVRASANKMFDRLGLGPMGLFAPPSASTTLAHAQAHGEAWTMAACVLVGAGVLSWTVKEARLVLEVGEEPERERRPRGATAVGKEDRSDSEERPEDAAGAMWDPLEITAGADDKRWRSVEVKHGHLSMIAHVGFVAAVQCSSSAPSSDIESGSTRSPEQSLAAGDSSAQESSSDLDSEEIGQQLPTHGGPAGAPEKAANCRSPNVTEGDFTKPPSDEDVETSQKDEIDRAAEGEPEVEAVAKAVEKPLFSFPRGSAWSDFLEDDEWGTPKNEQPNPEPEAAADALSVLRFPRGSVWSDFDDDAAAVPPGLPPPEAHDTPESREDLKALAPAEDPAPAEGAAGSILCSMPRGSAWSALTEDDLPDAGCGWLPADAETEAAKVDAVAKTSPGRRPPARLNVSPPAEDVPAPFVAELRAPVQGDGVAAPAEEKKSRKGRQRPKKTLRQQMGEDPTQVQADVRLAEWQQNPVDVREHYGASCSSRPAQKKMRKVPRDRDLKMPDILRCLEFVDQERVVIVRKMKKLGFNSAVILRAYFEQFGAVENIYVSHSHLAQRMRPSSLGFVVFASAEARQMALALGTQREIEGARVFLGAFEQLGDNKDFEE